MYKLVKMVLSFYNKLDRVCQLVHFEAGCSLIGRCAGPLVTYSYRQEIKRCGKEWYLRDDC